MNPADLDPPYCYYAYAIDPLGGVDYLHYGIWDDEARDIKQAQEHLARLMKSLIPDDVIRILDAGCGLGRTSHDLAASGHEVTGISPDSRNMAAAKEKYPEIASRLVTSKFETYTSRRAFDMVLFQESSQYIPLPIVLDHSLELLKTRGYLLVCDEVQYQNIPGSAFHLRDDIIQQGEQRGLELLHNEILTSRVLPTRDFLVDRLLADKLEISNLFRSIHHNVESEINEIITGWQEGTRLFKEGAFGYEVFLFRKRN